MFMKFIIMITVLMLSACATTPSIEQIVQVKPLPKLPVRVDIFNTDLNSVISVPQIFLLSQFQKNHFLDFYYSEEKQSLTDLERIFEYLEIRMDNFNFHSDTLTAQDVLDKNTGNCLSLAILTKSLADLVDIKVKYELVETPTIYQKEQNIMLNYRHIRTMLYGKEISGDKNSYFTKKIMRVDYFPLNGTRTLRQVPENEFYSMYYNNKAVEALVDEKINLAYTHTKKSLSLMPANAEAVSMMGVIHDRLGFVSEAEKLYQYGLTYGREEEVLLKNYHSLLIRLKKTEEADQIALKLLKYQDTNPFKWIEMADHAYQEKDYKQAIDYYSKAAKIASYLHEPYAGIARAKHHLGKNKAASDSMLKALVNSHKSETTRLYQSKYEFFQTMANHN